jgi:hypothetical protein
MAVFDICPPGLKRPPSQGLLADTAPKLMAHIPLNNITYRGMNGGAYADSIERPSAGRFR